MIGVVPVCGGKSICCAGGFGECFSPPHTGTIPNFDNFLIEWFPFAAARAFAALGGTVNVLVAAYRNHS